MPVVLAVAMLAATFASATEITVTLTDSDQQQLFGDDMMMDQCLLHGGARCARVQQLLLLRVQEALRRAEMEKSKKEEDHR